MSSLKRTLVFSNRNIKEILRDPVSLVFLYFMPIVMLVLFYTVFHNLTQQFEMKYLAPGMVSFSHVFLALFCGQMICYDRETSFLSRLFTTPLKAKEYIFGYALSLIPIGLSQTFIILGLASIIDFKFFSFNILWCIPFSIISILLFVGFGLLLGSLLNSKSIGGVSSMLIMCQSMLSGMWFPLESLSKGFNNLIEVLPFRSGTLLFQNLCLGFTSNYMLDIIKPLGILSAYTIFIIVISILVFSLKMKED